MFYLQLFLILDEIGYRAHTQLKHDNKNQYLNYFSKTFSKIFFKLFHQHLTTETAYTFYKPWLLKAKSISPITVKKYLLKTCFLINFLVSSVALSTQKEENMLI